MDINIFEEDNGSDMVSAGYAKQFCGGPSTSQRRPAVQKFRKSARKDWSNKPKK
jgi:hypothetical protein